MPDTPSVDGQVPLLPELDDVSGVPPVRVEVAVGELHDLANGVQERVEDQVEHRQPDQVIRNLEKIIFFAFKLENSFSTNFIFV